MGVRTGCPKFFLKCHAAAADNRSHAADRHFRTPIVRRFAPPAPFPPGSGGAKRVLQAPSLWGSIPNSAATSVAALPLLSQSSTACCLKVLSNFFRVCLDWITGAFIVALPFNVSLYLCPPKRAGPLGRRYRRGSIHGGKGEEGIGK